MAFIRGPIPHFIAIRNRKGDDDDDDNDDDNDADDDDNDATTATEPKKGVWKSPVITNMKILETGKKGDDNDDEMSINLTLKMILKTSQEIRN